MKSRLLALATVVMGILLLAASCPNDDSPPPSVNLSPVASFTRTPSSGDSPLEVAFDGSASSDPDGWITQYQWDFGDGETGTGVTTSHTYTTTTSRTYTARLTVADNEEETTSASRLISVSVATTPPPPSNNYVASRNSDVFHRLSCHYVDQINPENKIYFSTRDEAIASGRRPCKVCSP